MDLMYLPESLSFQSRMFGWGRHEQEWVNVNAKPDEKTVKKEKSTCTVDEKNCSICKQKQKRALATYINKARKDSDRDICIEEEEEEEKEEAKEEEEEEEEGQSCTQGGNGQTKQKA